MFLQVITLYPPIQGNWEFIVTHYKATYSYLSIMINKIKQEYENKK